MSEKIGYKIRQGFIPYEESALTSVEEFANITVNSLKKIGHCVILNFKSGACKDTFAPIDVPTGFRPTEEITFYGKASGSKLLTCTLQTNGRLTLDAPGALIIETSFEISNAAWQINPDDIISI